ncbi:MAG: fasciclin domain-containing protein [Flavobacteriaceae bacterium]
MNNRIYILSLLMLAPILLLSQGLQSVGDVAYFENSIIHSTRNSTDHTTLSEAVIAAELDAVLDSDGPFTIFAPSDQAFEKLSKEKIKDLMLPQNKSKLQSLLTYHMIAGYLSASKILKEMCRGEGVATFRTVQGNVLTATMDGIDIVLSDSFGNKAKITNADSNQCNGVIHVIDSVVLPKKI